MMLSSFPASPSSSAHIRRSSFLRGNPKPFTKIKNSKISIEFLKISGAGTLTRLFVDSSLRESVKCFSQEEKQQLLQEDEVEVYEFERLFSNLNQSTLKREPGSLSSSIFLVAGTAIGAGILAIPAVTQESGFLASAVICILCWVFMVITGLLIAEVNVNTMSELGTGGVSLVSMAMRTLGNTGVQVACWSYVFIHYALLVAYVARSSEILTNYLGIPIWETATLFSLLFGGLCYFGSQRIVGAVNGALVVSIIVSFVALVSFLGSSQLLKRDQILFWTHYNYFDQRMGVVGPIVDVFSVLAISTSYIRFVLGLSDFLADLLKLPTGQNRPLPYVLTLLPPLILSLLDPEIFFKALDFAGTYGVLVLFGVLPAAMSRSDRYSGLSESLKIPLLVPGGKLTLSLVMAGSGLVILTEILENFGRA